MVREGTPPSNKRGGILMNDIEKLLLFAVIVGAINGLWSGLRDWHNWHK